MNDVVQDEVVDTQQNREEVADVKVKKAFPISKRTKNDQSRTSVVYTVASVVLYVLAYLPIFLISLVLGIKCYNLMPYYSFWPFVGVIIAGLFGVIFMTITLVVTRKNPREASVRKRCARSLRSCVSLVCSDLSSRIFSPTSSQKQRKTRSSARICITMVNRKQRRMQN